MAVVECVPPKMDAVFNAFQYSAIARQTFRSADDPRGFRIVLGGNGCNATPFDNGESILFTRQAA